MRKQYKQARKPRRSRSQPEVRTYEASAAEGLEQIARRELSTHLDKRVTLHRLPGSRGEPGTFRFDYTGGLRALLRMKTIQTIYLVRRFDVPRPRGLLGNEHFTLLLKDIAAIRAVYPEHAFNTFYISAAGHTSTIMQRFKQALAEATGLKEGFEEGDLLLRLRKTGGEKEAWEVLLRISPRPLTTRPWRVCNMEGALNATVAHAMTLLTDPQPYDTFLNLACGSGTLLVERLTAAPARRVIGCDTSPEARQCAHENIDAASLSDQIEIHDWDARTLPLEDDSVDALCADLPFGHLVGDHADNVSLYPAVLTEAGRVARPGALFVLITHEIKLLESVLADSALWEKVGEQRVALGGLYPRIFILKRHG